MSDKELMLDVGQANELKLAFRRNGWTNEDVKALSKGDILAHILPVIRGLGEVQTVKHIIDCDAHPFVPDDWKVVEHQKGGVFKWDPAKVSLHLDKGQEGGKRIQGNNLRKELADKSVLNANVLDYLLANPHLILEEWKGKAVFFWGTIYRDRRGDPCVRYLYWHCGRWHWSAFWLRSDWRKYSPAAVLAI